MTAAVAWRTNPADPSAMECLRRLDSWGAKRRWVGADPYEGLNTAAGRAGPTRRARQVVIQAYKRSRYSLPWPLRASTRPNAKALALALAAYSTPAGRRLGHAERFLAEIPPMLERLNLLPQGAAWGYHFDVQTRGIAYDRSTPNAIATCFVVGSLLDSFEATGEEANAQQALAARGFLASLLTRNEQHGPYFCYVASGSHLVHNANLLVCGALARLHELEPDAALRAVVLDAVATTLGCQRTDGLWEYGETPSYRWIDNFHTAYTLEGLVHVNSAFGAGREALDRGLTAWRAAFFEPDGWARYYPDRHHPLEAHSCASAIDLLCLIEDRDERPSGAGLVQRIADVAIRELWLSNEDRFAFRRTAYGLNRREFMRWTNAPMFRALATLISTQEGIGA